jgi:hypothetical protein
MQSVCDHEWQGNYFQILSDGEHIQPLGARLKCVKCGLQQDLPVSEVEKLKERYRQDHENESPD